MEEQSRNLFFRARIPKQFQLYFTGTEIKKTLRTDSFRLAVKLARAYRVKLDEEMTKLEKGTYGAYQVTLEGQESSSIAQWRRKGRNGHNRAEFD